MNEEIEKGRIRISKSFETNEREKKRKREVVRQRWRSSKIRKREKVEFGLKIERGISKMYIVDKR